MPARTEEDYERIARQWRVLLQIDDQPQPDMITVVFKLKSLGTISDYRRVPDDHMPNDEAYYDPLTKVLSLRESTFRSANFSYSAPATARHRARFTIAHELGHIVLGHSHIRFRGTSSAIAQKVSSNVRIEEIEANKFASAFLAPAHLAME